jgi:hypothetical protein
MDKCTCIEVYPTLPICDYCKTRLVAHVQAERDDIVKYIVQRYNNSWKE